MKKLIGWMAAVLMAGSVMAGNLIDGTCDIGITNTPPSGTPPNLTTNHADKGWYASNAGQYSNNLGRIYRVPNINNTSGKSVAQVINNAKALTGTQPLVFDYSYEGATSQGNVQLYLHAWNASLTVAESDIGNQDDNGKGTTILLPQTKVAADATARSGTYSNNVDFGAGYDYVSLQITIKYLGASGVGYIDNVQLGTVEPPTRGTTFLIK